MKFRLDGIAKKLGVSERDVPKSLLRQGAKVEMEHTGHWPTAKKIALDHLAEDRDYYKKLKQVERKDTMAKRKHKLKIGDRVKLAHGPAGYNVVMGVIVGKGTFPKSWEVQWDDGASSSAMDDVALAPVDLCSKCGVTGGLHKDRCPVVRGKRPRRAAKSSKKSKKAPKSKRGGKLAGKKSSKKSKKAARKPTKKSKKAMTTTTTYQLRVVDGPGQPGRVYPSAASTLREAVKEANRLSRDGHIGGWVEVIRDGEAVTASFR